ncbi:hypothetical protein SCANM63S_04593 [Streptomyces canarius]
MIRLGRPASPYICIRETAPQPNQIAEKVHIRRLPDRSFADLTDAGPFLKRPRPRNRIDLMADATFYLAPSTLAPSIPSRNRCAAEPLSLETGEYS